VHVVVLATCLFGPVVPGFFGILAFDAFQDFGVAVDTSRLEASLQAYLGSMLAAGVDGSNLFFVEAGITLSDLVDLLNSQQPPVALATMGGSDGQSLAGAISTGTHGGDFDRPPLADSVRAIYLIGAGSIHYWIESASNQITNPQSVVATFPCIAAANVIYEDDTFNSVLVSMGGMGVIYALVLETVPQFCLLQMNSEPQLWEQVSGAEGGRDFVNLFNGTISGIASFLASADPNTFPDLGSNRFLEVIINPIPDGAGHSCIVINRAQLGIIPPQGQPGGSGTPNFVGAIMSAPEFIELLAQAGITAGVFSAGAVIAGLGQLFGGDLGGALTSILTGLGIGGGAAAADTSLLVAFATLVGQLGGMSQIDQGQALLTFCKSNGISWPIRAVVDAYFANAFPPPTDPPQPFIDLGFKVMAGGSLFGPGLNLKGEITSMEAFFPFHEAVNFISEFLANTDAQQPGFDIAGFAGRNIFPAGYISLRACRRTQALLGMEKFGSSNPEAPSDVCGTVEIGLLLDPQNSNSDALTLISFAEVLAQRRGGILHWGQSNGRASDVPLVFGRAVATWRSVQSQLGGRTFTNAFMTRNGLA
jgi:hypothetical protein